VKKTPALISTARRVQHERQRVDAPRRAGLEVLGFGARGHREPHETPLVVDDAFAAAVEAADQGEPGLDEDPWRG
jgi:hypothetical protein